MQFLKQLTDPALKRLYKFILKRLIGRYLAQGDLDLNQLDVHLRAGSIELCDLTLNIDTLNEEIQAQWNDGSNGVTANSAPPLRITKGYVGSVRVRISYSNLLTESCVVEFDDVDIVLGPADGLEKPELIEQRNLGRDVGLAKVPRLDSAKDKTAVTEDAISQEGLDFVASWIEQVSSKIKVTIANLCVRVEAKVERQSSKPLDRNDGTEVNVDKVAFVCWLKWAQFMDESISHVKDTMRNSLDAMRQSISSEGLFAVMQKGIRFRDFGVELVVEERDGTVRKRPLLRDGPSRQGYIQLKVAQFGAIEIPAFDIDMFLHSVEVVLEPQDFCFIELFVDAFTADRRTKWDSESMETYNGFPFRTFATHDSIQCLLSGEEADQENLGACDGVDLSIFGLERIDELLSEYKRTKQVLQQELRNRSEEQSTFYNDWTSRSHMRRRSSLESGKDDEDIFFDCNSTAVDYDSTKSAMNQSLYVSAINHDRVEGISSFASLNARARSLSSHQIKSRAKLHLLECCVLILYEDRDNKDHSISEQVPSHPFPLICEEERLEIVFKDLILSTIQHNLQLLASMTVSSFEILEKTTPSCTIDALDESVVLNSISILRFTGMASDLDSRLQCSSCLTAQASLDYELDNASQSKRLMAINFHIFMQPMVLECDMYTINRATNLLKLLEEPVNKQDCAYAFEKRSCVKKSAEITAPVAQIVVRFPMIHSDCIRYGPSSTRGLCEDKLTLTLRNVHVVSTEDEEESVSKLPWLSEYSINFERIDVKLLSKAHDNQRTQDDLISDLLTCLWKDGEQCNIRIRLQNPVVADVEKAVEYYACVSEERQSGARPFREDIDCKDNATSAHKVADTESGRIGSNGWSASANRAAQDFEHFAAKSSTYAFEISAPSSSISVEKMAFKRLMILIDGLLAINPVDVDQYNADHHNTILPSYMSINFSSKTGSVCIKASDDTDATSSYTLLFQAMKLFCISQWKGQLISYLQTSVQNMTLFSGAKILCPILYRSPFEAYQAPVLYLAAEITSVNQEMREVAVNIHISHTTLRYDPSSNWLFELIDIMLVEYPPPIIPFDSCNMTLDEYKCLLQRMANGLSGNVLAIPLVTLLTKVHVRAYDSIIDYAPSKLDSRAMFLIGHAEISTNIVSSAALLGYKITAKDLELFLIPSQEGYHDVDRLILGSELVCKQEASCEKPSSSYTRTELYQNGSVLAVLEDLGYLQIATMDSAEVFLRSCVQDPVTVGDHDKLKTRSNFPELSVELTLGTANLYACFDSLLTLTELLSDLADQVMDEEEPRDMSGYVGLDHVKDTVSGTVGRATAYKGLEKTSFDGSEIELQPTLGVGGRSDAANAKSRGNVDGKGSVGTVVQTSFNMLDLVEENAFGTGLYSGKHVASDTEARLLQTRLDEIGKARAQFSKAVINSWKAQELNGQIPALLENENEIIAQGSRINELLIEDYYTAKGDQDIQEVRKEFAKVPKKDASPWFVSKDEVVAVNNAGSLNSRTSEPSHPSHQVKEAQVWRSSLYQLANDPMSIAQSRKPHALDPLDNSHGRFKGILFIDGKHARDLEDTNSSNLHTEDTRSTFSQQQPDQTRHNSDNDDLYRENLLSLSLYGAGEDDDTEVELDFELDTELEAKLHQLFREDTDTDAYENDGQDLSPRDNVAGNVGTYPADLPYGSVAQTNTKESSPSASSSTLEEYTAQWYHDSEDNSGSQPGIFPNIYRHHVEIPIGGAAASLSFGERECAFAIQKVAKECRALKIEASTPITRTHILLRDFNVCMRLFGGSDWKEMQCPLDQRPGNGTASHVHGEVNKAIAIKKIEHTETSRKERLLNVLLDDYIPSTTHRVDNHSTLFPHSTSAPDSSSLFNDTSTQKRPQKKFKSARKTEEMMELYVRQVQMRVDMYSEKDSQPLSSNIVLAVEDFELLDYISTSQIRKIVCYWKSDTTHPRESGSSIVKLQLMTIRPGPNLCPEHRLKMRFLPFRVNLNQEVVNFLRSFASLSCVAQTNDQVSSSEANTSPVPADGTELVPLAGPKLKATDLRLEKWFFQSVDVRACKVKIDYHPNRVDYRSLRDGDYFEVINLFVLEGMELVLRHVKLSGIDGWASLAENVLMSWTNDISRHQIHKCLASVTMPPLRSFANIGSGAADLILLPMEHYGKDRRLVRGIKKGAKSFLRSVTIETLNTASKVALGTQTLLEHADDLVSFGSTSIQNKQYQYRKKGSRIKRNSKKLGGGGIRSAHVTGSNEYLMYQPANAVEGLEQAYNSFSRELHVAAKTIVAIPLVEYKKTGSQGYVRSVIRAVPVAILRPMIGATEAFSKALIGVRNGVDPELKEDIENKFKDFRSV